MFVLVNVTKLVYWASAISEKSFSPFEKFLFIAIKFFNPFVMSKNNKNSSPLVYSTNPEAIQSEPWNLEWKYEFAWFLIDNDIDVKEGLKIADEALEQDPEYWPALDARGWALYKLGKSGEALKLLKDSWDLKFAYSHTGYLHIQELERALAE